MVVTKADDLQEWIFVVDEDQSVRETLQASGMHVRCFLRARECLAQLCRGRCDLLITDLQRPQMNGLRLLEQVKELSPWVPVLIVTGHGDVPTAVRAIKGGAVDFVEKPLRKADFVGKVKLILRRSHMAALEALRDLTAKEMEVFRLIVAGRSNREIAEETNRHVKTIEAHRADLMRKLGARNVIELLKLGADIGLVVLPTKQGPGGSMLQTNERLPMYVGTRDDDLDGF
jgi:two-component system response regulator FixJ